MRRGSPAQGDTDEPSILDEHRRASVATHDRNTATVAMKRELGDRLVFDDARHCDCEIALDERGHLEVAGDRHRMLEQDAPIIER